MALPTHSAWTSPQTATGDAIPTPGQSSPAPPGTPASLATRSLLGPPSSARSASSFLPSRRAPVAPRAVPTWLGSGQPADRTTARVLLQMWLADIVKELKRCVRRDDVTLEENSWIGSAVSPSHPHFFITDLLLLRSPSRAHTHQHVSDITKLRAATCCLLGPEL